MIAVCMLRPDPHYRSDAFISGLKRAGYEMVERGKPSGPEDLLVIWNRYGPYDDAAKKWEASGGTVLVCENGYAGKDENGRHYYAIAVHGHNGSGWFPVGDEDRFAKLGLKVQPWQDNGEGHIVVRGQRGIGPPDMASPPHWHQNMAKRLRGMTDRKIVVREHPGRDRHLEPVGEYLAGAWALVIWCSSVGVAALIDGIPVMYDAPHWICEDGALRFGQDIALLNEDAARQKALHRMAWGQRSIAEIETGEPFVTIRERIGDAKW